MGDLTKNFSIKEFEKSETATRLKIDNSIPDEYVGHVKLLAEQLQILRDAFGSGLTINSGYRCEKLNKAVKGSATSAHLKALAADIIPSNGDMKTLQEIAKKLVDNKTIKVDQLIFEKPKNGISTWLHIGVGGKNRQQTLTIN